MCLSAHNYLTFGSGGHIITWVLDQSTLENLRSRFVRTDTVLSKLPRFSTYAINLVFIVPSPSINCIAKNAESPHDDADSLSI